MILTCVVQKIVHELRSVSQVHGPQAVNPSSIHHREGLSLSYEPYESSDCHYWRYSNILLGKPMRSDTIFSLYFLTLCSDSFPQSHKMQVLKDGLAVKPIVSLGRLVEVYLQCLVTLSTRWSWVVGVTLWLWEPLHRKVGWTQIQPGHSDTNTTLSLCWALKPDSLVVQSIT
jgi:hypothetical protein